jgi:hypothetical protein
MCSASVLFRALGQGIPNELVFARFSALGELLRPRTKHKRQNSDSPGLAWLCMCWPGQAWPCLTSLGLAWHRLAPRLASASLVLVASPSLASPRLASPCLASPRPASPRLASPCLASPRLDSPCLATPCSALPRLASSCFFLPQKQRVHA